MPSFDEEYTRLAHALQTGVKYEQENGSDDGSPKHLRVGVNLRAVEHTALVTLLVEKGVFTLEEYGQRVLDMLQLEVEKYEQSLSQKLGTTITLG